MRKLVSEQGKLEAFCCWLTHRMDYWWVKFFVLPMLQTVPPGFIIFSIDHNLPGATSNRPEGAEMDSANQIINGMVIYFAEHPYLSFLYAAIYLVVLNGLISIIREQAVDVEEIDSKGLLTLFQALETVVGAKANRFGEYLKLFKSGSKTTSDVFENITKPDQQIAMIAASLHGFFDAIDVVGVGFRVCVISVDAGIPSDFYYYHPNSEPPKAEIEDLQSEESTVSACIKKKDIIIVPDVQEEIEKENDRQYVGSMSGQDERSLICYPVIHHYTDSIPYVIAIVADKKDYFRTEKKRFYRWVFKHFAVRMALEHSLLLLKQESQDNEK